MPGRKSKYSAEYNSEMKVALMDTLLNCEEAVNIDQLKAKNIYLAGITNQKASRLMNELVDMGIAAKSQDKVTKRVVYKALEIMKKQGYEIGENKGYEYNED